MHLDPYYVITGSTGYLNKASRKIIEKRYFDEKRKQPGVAFPSATKQKHIFILRFDISDSISGNNGENIEIVRTGLKKICRLFDKISVGEKKINELSEDGDLVPRALSHFNFSATIGFGSSFFRKLDIPERNTPKKIKDMPDYLELGDITPYSMHQTDFIIQLGADDDYINRWVYQNQVGIVKKQQKKNVTYNNYQVQTDLQTGFGDSEDNESPDIFSTIRNWTKITDLHNGFQRLDGKNLLGFNDGISNPFRLSNDVIWTTSQEEHQKFQDGTYMVFQKVEHDLEKWQSLHEEKQELWVGRSKGTGLLLGTLSKDEDRKLALDLLSTNDFLRGAAIKKWKMLYNQQKSPDTKFYDPAQSQFRGIQLECPVWSHVRKANPRQLDGAADIRIFRRGYLYNDDSVNGKSSSGLLFICFQKDIERGFEYIKKKFLNNVNFPVPRQRKSFNHIEVVKRRQQGRLTTPELQALNKNIKYHVDDNTQNTGRDGLSGPSENGVYQDGQFPVTITLGGGYYFIPPIPRKKISEIGEQFFD